MLTSFQASNFKSIKHLSLPLHPFMVLVGPNGAGKTNVVQALELLGAMLEQGSVEPVRETGYDEIIRREKACSRGYRPRRHLYDYEGGAAWAVRPPHS